MPDRRPAARRIPRVDLPVEIPVEADQRPHALAAALRHVVLASERWRLRVARTSLGVGATEMMAVATLGAEGSQTPSQLAARLQITTPSVSELIDRLERAGLAGRTPHPHDRRKTVVGLSQDGRRYARTVLARYADMIDRATRDLDDRTRDELAQVLGELGAALDGASGTLFPGT
ncbi:MAG: MarR family transcriptional regulator [Pseudonocardia sp.]|uniref:MarR family winged helix-turn-helix transcriptional regulator n=1 Tax=Pseudonocardia sp. TaxID=60912 RepID=UPI001AC97CF7|nr:MarR family transcriptional regulator [Pseudonocardia sp.]MBN9101052.1 MarR family transcriptional regulator [Pseudonocardia sp.]